MRTAGANAQGFPEDRRRELTLRNPVSGALPRATSSQLGPLVSRKSYEPHRYRAGHTLVFCRPCTNAPKVVMGKHGPLWAVHRVDTRPVSDSFINFTQLSCD